jgi:hypothetical protein
MDAKELIAIRITQGRELLLNVFNLCMFRIDQMNMRDSVAQ